MRKILGKIGPIEKEAGATLALSLQIVALILISLMVGLAADSSLTKVSSAKSEQVASVLNEVVTISTGKHDYALRQAVTIPGPWPAPPASPTPTPCFFGLRGNAGGFQIDGDFFSNGTFTGCQPPTAAGGTIDWAGPNGVLLQDGSGTVIIPPFGGPFTYNPATNALWFRDDIWAGNNTDRSAFAGGQRNDQFIQPGSQHWRTANGSGNAQNDITNVYVYAPNPSATTDGHRWLIFGAETRGQNSFLDFEYNQAGVTWDPIAQTITGCTPGGSCVGGRTVGDLLIQIDFSNGGTLPSAGIRIWQSDGTWSVALCPCDPRICSTEFGCAFVVTNNVSVPAVAPGGAVLPNGDPSDTTFALQFLEAAIDITALGFPEIDPSGPFPSVTVKTRANGSFTSALQDFVLVNFDSAVPRCNGCPVFASIQEAQMQQSFNSPSPGNSICPFTSHMYCGPNAVTYAWSISGNGSIVGPTDGRFVTVNAGSSCNAPLTLDLTVTGPSCSDSTTKDIIVQDTTTPTIGPPGADQTIECPAPSPLPFTPPTASDNCGAATVINLGDTTSGSGCNYIVTRSWVAEDACLNTSGTVRQTLTIVQGPTPTPTPLPGTLGISGVVTYCIGNPRPVPSVNLNLTGDMTISTMTNEAGEYSLLNIQPGGSYVVTPAPLRDLQPVVDPHPDIADALRVAAHVVSGGTLLTGCAELAAHATGNTTVDVGDALAIQQFVNNRQLSPSNLTGKWRFVPVSRTYNSLSSDRNGQNYDAYVIGDVTGAVIFPTSAPTVPPEAIKRRHPRLSSSGKRTQPVRQGILARHVTHDP